MKSTELDLFISAALVMLFVGRAHCSNTHAAG
jgi:hypothetical protein